MPYSRILILSMITTQKIVVVLSGDHIYSMDYNEMIDYHLSKGATGTVACVCVFRCLKLIDSA